MEPAPTAFKSVGLAIGVVEARLVYDLTLARPGAA
jgi:hypothetical protein